MLRTFWLFVVSTSTSSLFVVEAEKVRTVIGAQTQPFFEGAEILGGDQSDGVYEYYSLLLLILIVITQCIIRDHSVP